MNKDAFITFAKEKWSCDTLRGMLDINVECERCKYKFESMPVDCKKLLLEDEYQPPKQEKWVVHRKLRTENKEVYIGYKDAEATRYYIDYNKYNKLPTTYNKDSAFRYDFGKAISFRDKLNEKRVGKQYLWAISKVEN